MRACEAVAGLRQPLLKCEDQRLAQTHHRRVKLATVVLDLVLLSLDRTLDSFAHESRRARHRTGTRGARRDRERARRATGTAPRQQASM